MADVIEGVIRRIKSHSARWSRSGTPYLIAVLDNGETIKGEMSSPANSSVVGERCRFYGEVRPDKYGKSFCFDFYEPIIDNSSRGIVDYLSRHVDGIGYARAKLIFDTLGSDTLHILRTDCSPLANIPNFPPHVIDKIAAHFAECLEFDPAAYARLVDLLAVYKIARNLVKRIVKDLGSGAPEKIQRDPYLLLDYPGIGWDTVDSVALKLGYPKDGVERHSAAIIEILKRTISEGHTVASRIDIRVGCTTLLKMFLRADAWTRLDDMGRIAVIGANSDNPDSGYVTTPRLEYAERYIAERIALLRRHAPVIDIDPAIPILAPEQQAAVAEFFRSGFLILSGAPGVGKTFCVAQICEILLNIHHKIHLMAPTGKAAKRAAELIWAAIGEKSSQIPCTTIHRALGIGPNDEEEGVPADSARKGRGRQAYGFNHGETNPIDATVFIIDEMSMVDASLFASLLAAIPLGAIVLLVGDADQLPSVGPGSVLRDLTLSGIPSVTLTQIRRSDGGGRVVRACHAIRDGRIPEPAPAFQMPTENWLHIEAETPEQIAATIVERVAKIKAGSKLGFDAMEDVQVISAQKKKAFGCHNLNRLLSSVLNPQESPPQDDKPQINKNDKVIRRKNASVDGMVPAEFGMSADWSWDHPDYPDTYEWSFVSTPVVNGDMGRVKDIVISDRGAWAVVQFRNPDRLCRIPLGSSHLEQAYCITVHSSQGSGFPVTIVPVHDSFFFNTSSNVGLWCRELLYTAISRAEKILITVGSFESIRTAIRRRTIGNRRTWLPHRIAEVAAAPPRDAFPTLDYEDASAEYQPTELLSLPSFNIDDI